MLSESMSTVIYKSARVYGYDFTRITLILFEFQVPVFNTKSVNHSVNFVDSNNEANMQHTENSGRVQKMEQVSQWDSQKQVGLVQCTTSGKCLVGEINSRQSVHTCVNICGIMMLQLETRML